MLQPDWDVASGKQADFERALLHVPENQHAPIRNTRKLREAFDEICKASRVHQGRGPPLAYFETVTEPPRRYVYIAFSMGGEKPQGEPMQTAETGAEVLAASITFFRGWLKPNQTLVWREEPSVDFDDDRKKWASYWRCIQLDDDAREIAVKWWF